MDLCVVDEVQRIFPSKSMSDVADSDPVPLVDEDHVGSPMLCLFLGHFSISSDDYLVASLNLSSGCAVDAYSPAVSGSRKRICRESFTVCDVPDVNLFEGHEARSFHQGRVDLDASLVVQV